MRMTFLHRTAISWTLSLPKPFEGYIITEVGNLIDYIKILKAVTLLQAEHKSCTVCWTTHQCYVFTKTSKPFSKSWLPPSRFQMRDVVTHRVCFSSTLISTISKNIFHTQLLCFCRNFSPSNWRAENSVPSVQTYKKYKAWFVDHLPARWGVTSLALNNALVNLLWEISPKEDSKFPIYRDINNTARS